MKFSLLPVGSRFAYEDEVYVKTSPLIASLEATGGQRLIARAANVKPLGHEAGGETPAAQGQLEEARVLEAVQAYHEHCLALFEHVAETMIPAEAQALRKALEQGLKDCKQSLAAARANP